MKRMTDDAIDEEMYTHVPMHPMTSPIIKDNISAVNSRPVTIGTN